MCSTVTRLAKALAGLGPEPLSREFTVDGFVKAAASSRLPAKLFLMDQKRVAGLGNVYAAEALFRAGIHPARPMNRLSADRARVLYDAIRDVLREAVRSAKIAYNRPGKYTEAAEWPRAVYRREGETCLRCGARIRRIKQAGRSTYFCARCQR
jgi:formamidopyrimidine-DNA glycosylase